MGKKNKKRKAERKEIAQQYHQNLQHIKAESLEMSKRSRDKIPGTVAILSLEEELFQEINDSTFSLVFEHYDNKMCGIPQITNNSEAEKIINIFKRISKSTPNIIQKVIKNTIRKEEAENDYAKLFSHLPEDIDKIHEAQFSGTGRVFFFTVEGKHNFACVVSINPNHLS